MMGTPIGFWDIGPLLLGVGSGRKPTCKPLITVTAVQQEAPGVEVELVLSSKQLPAKGAKPEAASGIPSSAAAADASAAGGCDDRRRRSQQQPALAASPRCDTAVAALDVETGGIRVPCNHRKVVTLQSGGNIEVVTYGLGPGSRKGDRARARREYTQSVAAGRVLPKTPVWGPKESAAV